MPPDPPRNPCLRNSTGANGARPPTEWIVFGSPPPHHFSNGPSLSEGLPLNSRSRQCEEGGVWGGGSSRWSEMSASISCHDKQSWQILHVKQSRLVLHDKSTLSSLPLHNRHLLTWGALFREGGDYALKGMVFAPFWSETGIDFANFWSWIGYGFRGNYRSVWTYLSFRFQIRKKEREICKLEMDWRILFLRSKLIVFAQRPGLKTGMENDIFWSEMGSGFGDRAAHSHREFLGVPSGGFASLRLTWSSYRLDSVNVRRAKWLMSLDFSGQYSHSY